MPIYRILSGTLAYTVATFALAVLWHVVLFKSSYDAFGYFEGEPNFALGLLTILIQGFALTILYQYVSLRREGLKGSMTFVFIAGVFFWTSHVLAFMAKQEINWPWTFVAMETLYLALQFGVFGFALHLIFRSSAH